MKFFQVDNREYFGTLGEAHEQGKKWEPVYRPQCVIKEIDIAADKGGVLQLLKTGVPRMLDATAASNGRSWTLTTRGGLVEVK